jgi:DNA modification methylase
MKIAKFEDGIAICGTFPNADVMTAVGDGIPLCVTDPPYGRILKNAWDRVHDDQRDFANTMLGWVDTFESVLLPRSALYIFGGIGIPNFRPFYEFMSRVERETNFKIANHITWSKRRAYGVQHNYLFTREEIAYLHYGEDIKKPLIFNVPLRDEKRGYAGFDPDYPAKSEYYRRTSVWTDVDGLTDVPDSDVWEVTELLRGKWHDAQKPIALIEIPIRVHTNPGDIVFDPFAGSGTTAFAARNLGRRFVLIEQDPKNFERLCDELRSGGRAK